MLVQFAEFLPYDDNFFEDLVIMMVSLLGMVLAGVLLMLVTALLISVVVLMALIVDFINGLFFPRYPSEAESQLTSETQ